MEENPGRPARYSGVGEYLIILVEEAVFREVYYHLQLVMSNFWLNQSKSDKQAPDPFRIRG